MFNLQDKTVRNLILKGEFGLERETLRITRDGYFATSTHPFTCSENIVRDFCENQLEINTGVHPDPRGAISELAEYTSCIRKMLNALKEPEYIWPFSNPPYIRSEEDIPIAIYTGPESEKTDYRRYLAKKYGKYKMTFSGIHLNFSFSPSLLVADFSASDYVDFTKYKQRLYLDLALQLLIYGWIITALTAASPLLDGSFKSPSFLGRDLSTGHASERCSEDGYFNDFVPVMDYSSSEAYALSIDKYVTGGLLFAPSELYFPIRLKAKGPYDTGHLINGYTHIELRMYDLNPLAEELIDEKDVRFAQLLCIYLLSFPAIEPDKETKASHIQTFWDASHYNLSKKMKCPDGKVRSMLDEGIRILNNMEKFYQDVAPNMLDIIRFQKDKFINPDHRYAAQIREIYGNGFVKKGLKLAKDFTLKELSQ